MSEGRLREGGCACGLVRYRITGEPMMVHNCHCRQCQQQTGSTSVVNGFWEADRLQLLSGELEEHVFPGGSGAPHTIARCRDCATALFSYYGRMGRLMVAVRAGSLDDPGSITPDVQIFTAEAMPWVSFASDIPRFDGYYNPREVLAQDALNRLRALGERRKAGEG
ncbi:GFA family protein [Aurantiacibacter rhizosphaerae]|uniref:GFA family protein n=1 Tax=Aurantiacibacter rhizosphaerae TaxID=2691582 RepID=A0A844XCQ1_9SPHN|nr:GFA family protein [Aurantiacibacter rhizosphaerae]MWV27285.1 GFA family protein [Aurantiacibacter rhizosphaerae]